MDKIFDLVYRSLKWLSKITGLTYEEVNIVIWFILIPLVFICLLDWILKTKYLKIGFAIVVLLIFFGVPDFETFSKTLFQKSVDFLNWFDYFGINYVQASVLICVLLPILIIAILFFVKRRRTKYY